ncbi:MAG: EAL domain-containing protein [Herminiimonas sp.]|nr:EAL domain-containing protein [Herminiimonas sp.]
MTTDITLEPTADFPLVKEFFLARQPILGRTQHLFAYELLFRRAATGPAEVVDDLSATASVIAHASELGMETVVGDSLAFVNVDTTVLMNDFVNFLSPQRVVLEILETVEVTPELITRVSDLANSGYTFALDDVIADSPHLQKLMPWVKIVKIDVNGMQHADLIRLVTIFKSAGKLLLAEKVETLAQFDTCLDLGFDYFQGYYFAKPNILSGKKLSPTQVALLHLMALITQDADNSSIEKCIKEDASLGLTLLRLVNTPAAGVTQRIDSLSQALVVLGRRQLQRWLQILLYAEPVRGSHFTSPLLTLATTRGRLMELIARKIQPSSSSIADTAFTVGIMSLMDTLFGLPMDKILEEIAVVDDVTNALLYRTGFYGDLLILTEYIERMDQAKLLLPPTLERLNLSAADLYALQVSAFEWCDQVSRSAH